MKTNNKTMDEIKSILSQPQTSQGANQLMRLYKHHNGSSLQVGCFCKQANISRAYAQVQAWVDSLN